MGIKTWYNQYRALKQKETTMIPDIKELLIKKLSEKTALPRQTEEKILNSPNSPTLDKFFNTELPKMEDVELDIMFSYIFTPDMEARISFGLYTEITLSDNEITELALDIESKNLIKILVDSEGKEHNLPLKEVNISRYIKLLHLNKPIPSELLSYMKLNTPQFKEVITALLRDTAIPLSNERIKMLEILLEGLNKNNLLNKDTCTYIVEFMDRNMIKDIKDFENKLLTLYAIYKGENEKKIYYSEELEGTYGGGNAMETHHDRMKEDKEKQKKLTENLKEVLGYLHDETPTVFN